MYRKEGGKKRAWFVSSRKNYKYATFGNWTKLLRAGGLRPSLRCAVDIVTFWCFL